MIARSRVASVAQPPGRGPIPAGTDASDVVHMDPGRAGRLRSVLIAPAAVGALAETFRALGDITRVRILDALSKSELCVCDLAAILALSESAVSHQLRLLRSMRLVRSRRSGRLVFYELDDAHIVTLFRQGLRHVEEGGPGRRAVPRRRVSGQVG